MFHVVEVDTFIQNEQSQCAESCRLLYSILLSLRIGLNAPPNRGLHRQIAVALSRIFWHNIPLRDNNSSVNIIAATWKIIQYNLEILTANWCCTCRRFYSLTIRHQIAKTGHHAKSDSTQNRREHFSQILYICIKICIKLHNYSSLPKDNNEDNNKSKDLQ